MNLFLKSYRIYLIFFLIITCESGFNRGFTKGKQVYLTPWIQEIKLPSRYTDIPNRSFFLDDLGHIFLGKDNGLTIIYGQNSVHLHMEGPVYVAGANSDTLFFACTNDLGYIARNDDRRTLNNGTGFEIISLKHRLPADLRNFIPQQLVRFENIFFILTDHGVYYLGQHTQGYFPNPGSGFRLHRTGEELYLVDAETQGSLRWSGEDFGEVFSRDRTGTFPWWFPGSVETGLPALNAQGITFADYINERFLLVSVRNQGIGIYDLQGRNFTHFGNKGGLPEQDIQQICFKGGSEIWILAPRSLHKINYPSSFDMLEINTEETGSIQVTAITGEGFMMGTSRGLYLAEQDPGNKNLWNVHSLTPDARESIHLLASGGNRQFAAGSRNLYCIKDGSAELLEQGSYTGLWPVDDHTLVAASEKGIRVFRFRDDGWHISQVHPLLPSSHSFAQHDDAVFFLCSGKVYMLADDLNSAICLPLPEEEVPCRLDVIGQKLYLTGVNQTYIYDRNREAILAPPGDPFAKILSSSDRIVPAGEGQYWIVKNESRYRSRVIHIRNPEDYPEEQIIFPVLQHLGEIISLDRKDSVVYLAGKDRVAFFDLSALDNHQGAVTVRIDRIRSEDTGTLDLEFASASEFSSNQAPMVLSYKSNDIEFHLAGLDYQSVPEPLFRYRLHPGQEAWSDWSSRRDIFLNDMHHGQYSFMAQSKDLFGQISDPVELSFIIEPPFYLTWYAYTFYVLLFLISLFLFRKWRLLSYQRAESRISLHRQEWTHGLAPEKEKPGKPVTGPLPERTAEQLKFKGKARWDKYERATVLFSDIQGFTRIAEEMNPELLIDELDKFFFHFDSVVDKYNIEKIKTIGDAYMAAGGIPEKNSTNPVEVVLAALEMQSYMQQLKSTKAEIWDLRIGIHTGPVIAGVVGHKKVSYDIWGDTVNTASRMESSGMPGKVNISGITYELVRDYFICEYRGKLPVKYKGNIDMYFVTGLRPELAVDLKGIPNKRFFVKLQLLRLGDLEERVFEEILQELPETLHFHTAEHARNVYDQSFLLCRSEEIEQEERLLVRTAALMLFTGLTQSYTNFENRSSVISREVLSAYQYSDTQIDQVCNLILAAKMPFDPHNLLEKILIDAKMEYIGRPDYVTRIKLLFQEVKESGRNITWQEFKQEQLELLSGFRFFTLAGQRLRELPTEEQLALLQREN